MSFRPQCFQVDLKPVLPLNHYVINKQGFCIDKRLNWWIAAPSIVPAQGGCGSQELAGHLSGEDQYTFAQVLGTEEAGMEGWGVCCPALLELQSTWKEFSLRFSGALLLSYGKMESLIAFYHCSKLYTKQLRSSSVNLFYYSSIRQLQTFQFKELLSLYCSPNHPLLTTVWDKIQLENLLNPVWKLWIIWSHEKLIWNPLILLY